jgi:hypothetical protein
VGLPNVDNTSDVDKPVSAATATALAAKADASAVGTAISDHVALPDPHSQYMTDAEVTALLAQKGAVRAIPKGWIDPSAFASVTWVNALGVKFYSNGTRVYPMLPYVPATRTEWRVPFVPRVLFPGTREYWVAVDIDAVLDDTKQGNAVTIYEVNVNTGNDTTGNGTFALPWKTMERAFTAVNAGAAGVYQINLRTTDFVPANSEGWNPGEVTINPTRYVKIKIMERADGTKPWLLPGMRRSGYLKANFAWQDIGDGWFKCTTGSISAAAKNTPIVFDLGTLDENGMPTPCLALTGVLADDAAVKAAANGQPAFYRRVADNHFYVKLASGAEPDPGINFAYVEFYGFYGFLLDQPSSIMIEGGRLINNTGISVSHGFQVKPKTLTLGPAQPLVIHDIKAVFKDVEVYGVGGSAFVFFDCLKSAAIGCTDGYCWLDGVNQSTFYTPGNSNSTAMGSNQHCFVDDHLSLYHGVNGFKDQPDVNTSANTFTTHSRCNMTVLNSEGGYSNGSGVAVVGGAKCLTLNVNSHDPKYVAPAGDTFASSYLASGASQYDANIKSEIWGFHCQGVVHPNGKTFYVGTDARIIMVYFQDKFSKQVDGAGIFQDGFGVSL